MSTITATNQNTAEDLVLAERHAHLVNGLEQLISSMPNGQPAILSDVLEATMQVFEERNAEELPIQALKLAIDCCYHS